MFLDCFIQKVSKKNLRGVGSIRPPPPPLGKGSINNCKFGNSFNYWYFRLKSSDFPPKHLSFEKLLSKTFKGVFNTLQNFMFMGATVFEIAGRVRPKVCGWFRFDLCRIPLSSTLEQGYEPASAKADKWNLHSFINIVFLSNQVSGKG